MHQDAERFLNLRTPPGRLTAEEAAWFLGFSDDEITILVAKGVLKPLGDPAQNGHKFFLAKKLEDLRGDEKWFNKATLAIVEFWRYKNRRKRRNAQGDRQQSQCASTPQFAETEN